MKYILILLMATSLFACRSSKQLAPDLTKLHLKFGSEGGVTGKGTFYFLFEDGQVFSLNTMGKTYASQKKISSKQAKDFFTRLKDAGFYDLKFNSVGNMTYRIESSVSGNKHVVTWTDQDKASDTILSIFKELNLTVNQK